MRPELTLMGLSALTVLAAAPARAQSIHDYLPATTMVAMSIPDLIGSIERFQSMPMAKMWAEEEVQDFVGDLMVMANSEIDKLMAQGRQMHENGALPVSPDELLKLKMVGGTFAITKMGFLTSEWGQPVLDFGFVVQLEFGESVDTWFELIKLATDTLEARAGPQLVKSTAKVGDVDVTTWTPNQANTTMSLNMARVGNSMVLATQMDDFAGILTNLAAQKPTLASSAAYKSAVAPLGLAKPEMTGYLQMEPMVSSIVNAVAILSESQGMGIDPDGVARALDAMGVNSIKSMASASSYVNGESVTRTYVVSPAPERKGIFTGASKPLDLGFLQWVPKDAVFVLGSSMDLASIYSGFEAGLRAYDPDVAEQILGQLGEMEQALGITIKDDLFGAFGDQMVAWSMPLAAMGSLPESAILIKVKDQARLLKTLNTMAESSNGVMEMDAVKRQGIEAHQVRFNLDTGGLAFDPTAMFVPTFSFKNGYLVMGFSAGDVKRAFDRMDREDDPKGDFRSNKEVASLIQNLPENVTTLSFTDWKSNFDGYYQMVTGVLAFAPIDQDVPIDLALLPDSSTLTQHLKPGMTYTVADANGFTSVAHSPFGPEVGVGLALAIGVGASFLMARSGPAGPIRVR